MTTLAFNIDPVETEPASGMISYWKFDEGTGEVARDSRCTNDGTIYGATWTSGIVDDALNFDGIDDYVEVEDSASLDIIGNITVEAWIRPRPYSPDIIMPVLNKWNDYEFGLDAGAHHRQIRFELRLNPTSWIYVWSNGRVNFNCWNHIAVTVNSTALVFYMNGTQDKVLSGQNVYGVSDENLQIGSYRFSYMDNFRFNGTIDEVAIYNKTLMPDEIQQHYDNGLMGLGYPYPVEHDIAVTNVTLSKTVVRQGHSVAINVSVENQVCDTETFNVTAYANTTIIDTPANITLIGGNSTTISVTWDTTNWVIGNYTISANATILPDEIDTADNTYVDGTVTVRPTIRDIAITDVAVCCGATLLHGGYTACLNTTVANEGEVADTFDVTAYWNATEIQTVQVTLANGTSDTTCFSWDTAGLPEYDTYNITAYAHPVVGETDLADNTFVYGIVTIVHKGDVNNDGKVRIDDILAIALAFGTDCGGPPNASGRYYEPNLDLNCDGKIRVDVILAAALEFGWPT